MAAVLHVAMVKNPAQNTVQAAPPHRPWADPSPRSQTRHPIAVVRLIVAERDHHLRNPRLERPGQRPHAAVVDQGGAPGERFPHRGPGHPHHGGRKVGGDLVGVLAEDQQPPPQGAAGFHHLGKDFPPMAHRRTQGDRHGRAPISQEPAQVVDVVAPRAIVVVKEPGVNRLAGQRGWRTEPPWKQQHHPVGTVPPRVHVPADRCQSGLGAQRFQRRFQQRIGHSPVDEPVGQPGKPAKNEPLGQNAGKHRWLFLATKHNRRQVRGDQRKPDLLAGHPRPEGQR